MWSRVDECLLQARVTGRQLQRQPEDHFSCYSEIEIKLKNIILIIYTFYHISKLVLQHI